MDFAIITALGCVILLYIMLRVFCFLQIWNTVEEALDVPNNILNKFVVSAMLSVMGVQALWNTSYIEISRKSIAPAIFTLVAIVLTESFFRDIKIEIGKISQQLTQDQ